jgi:hypothetical protein
MAITFGDKYRDEELRGTTAFEGQVIGKFTRCERVMSDVWDDITYAIVWDFEKAETRHFALSSSEYGCQALVDATDDVYELYEAYKTLVAAQAALDRLNRDSRDSRDRAEKAWHAVEKDKVMVVVRGRKVPKGTVGRVFWVDRLDNPYRAGLAVTDEVDDEGKFKDVAWVDADYLKNAEEYPGYKVIADEKKAEKIARFEADAAKGDQDAADVLKRIKERDRERQRVARRADLNW